MKYGQRPRRQAESSWGQSVAVALTVGAAALIAGLMLCDHILTMAYSFPPGAVSSTDELYKLGSGPRNGFASVLIPLTISAVVSTALLGGRHHRWAWVPPTVAFAVGLALSLYFVTTFQPPPPEVGG